MLLTRRGIAFRVSLIDWYIGAVFGWLMISMLKGVAARAAWTDPLFIVFTLVGVAVIAIALDNTMVMLVRGDVLHVLGVFRRKKLRRDSCRFVVERFGRLRSASHALLLTDGKQRRRIAYYWMWGGMLAERAAARSGSVDCVEH
jgi:hypothetical protein